MMVVEPATLGRERIVGRTVLSVIPHNGDHDSVPVRCPVCTLSAAVRAYSPGVLLDVDDSGHATCPTCGLMLVHVLGPLVVEGAEVTF
jgi:uncharacterized Zn-finger protein